MEKQVFLIRVQAMAAKENEGRFFLDCKLQDDGGLFAWAGLIFFPQHTATENELMKKTETSVSRIKNVS